MNLSIRRISMVAPMIVMLAAFAGCGDENTGSGGSGGTAGSGGSGASGGTGGTGGTGGMSSSSGSMAGSGGMGGGVPLVCDGGKVVDDADETKRCGVIATEVATVIMAPATMVWADKVVEVSSEYQTMEYSAKQTLGAPDVYPAGADEPKAWATLGLDNPNEFVTVSFTTPVIGEAVWVYETYNPGAVKKITITTTEGDKVIYDAAAKPIGACAHIRSAPTMTCAPISQVRIDLGSELVDGWNEIDAIGILPPP